MQKFLLNPRVRGLGAVVTVGALLSVSAPQQAAAKPAQIAATKYDLTGNQVVNAADVSEAAEQWQQVVAGEPLAAELPNADVTVNGMIDVSDIQSVAANSGQGTTDLALRSLATRSSTTNAVAEKVFVVDSAQTNEKVVNNGRITISWFNDVNPGDGVCRDRNGRCNLRAAAQETNAPRSPAYRARINFNIREGGVCSAEPVKIVPDADSSKWLQIDDSSGLGTIIDGYTQCGASPNTQDVDGNAVLKIEIVGTRVGEKGIIYEAAKEVNGIEIKSANNVIRGLSLYQWSRQIEISAVGAFYNRIEGNFIGTNAANTHISKPRSAHDGEGVRLQFGASYTVIGCGSFQGTTFVPCADKAQANAARNIIGGNGNDGIHIETESANFNRIVGNYIGISQDGVAKKAPNGTSISKNQADGVDFEEGASNNWLGGETALERNVVSGNQSEGIEISHNSATKENRVVGNWFGMDAFGKPAGNGDNGISVEDRANNTYIYRNYVGNNGDSGIRTYVFGDRNQIYENSVGVGPDGSAQPNQRHGVYLMGGSQHNMVRNNVIANNGDRGVSISTESDEDKGFFGETYFNTVSKNSIYNNRREGIKLTNKTDNQPVGNQGLKAPEIVAANATLVVGTTCPNCRVEVFLAAANSNESSGEGKTFVGEGTATGGGEFAVTVSGVAPSQLLTATSNDSSGNTSEFARNVAAGSGPVATLAPRPTVTPTPLPTATPQPTPRPAPGMTRRVWVPVTQR